MSTGFLCCRCKKDHAGSPVLANGAGEFCAACVAEMREKARLATRRHYAALGDTCLWCGQAITAKTRQPNKGHATTHVCQPCSRHVEWMLASIRHSDRVAKYAAATEAREAAAREERKRVAAAKPAPQTAAHIAPASACDPDNLSARMAGIETKLARLMDALGA